MSAANSTNTPALTKSEDRARRRAQEAVQEALDRRDNGGDGTAATEN